jgi:hypothetical protein
MLVGSTCRVHTVGFFLKADVILKCSQDISAGGGSFAFLPIEITGVLE